MDFIFHDGGRAAAGYKGMTGDCVTRSIAIATGKTYLEVYDALNQLAQAERNRARSACVRREFPCTSNGHRHFASSQVTRVDGPLCPSRSGPNCRDGYSFGTVSSFRSLPLPV